MPSKVPLEMKTFLVLEYYVTRNCEEVVRRFKRQWPGTNPPNTKTVKSLYDKFVTNGSVLDDYVGKAGRPVTVHTPENIEKVRVWFRNHRKGSLRACSSATGINLYSVWQILHENLNFKAYKIQTCQFLTEVDFASRLAFSDLMLQKIHDGHLDPLKIWFSDECHFHLSGYVNKQNHRIWGKEKPYIPETKPLHPEYVTVWIGICGRGHTNPYFFDGTVNSAAYLKMLQEFAFPWISERDGIAEYWWQQDGATAHRTNLVKNAIREKFGDRVIGLGFESEDGEEIKWPPRSPDMNPCDFAVWGILKEQVYKEAPKDKKQLIAAIKKASETLTHEMCKDICLNFVTRLDLLHNVEGQHFENVIP